MCLVIFASRQIYNTAAPTTPSLSKENIIVYSNVVNRGCCNIYVIDSLNGQTRHLLDDDALHYAPAISHSSRYITFATLSSNATSEKSSNLYLLDTDTGTIAQLTHLESSKRLDTPVWSYSDQYIAFLLIDLEQNKNSIEIIDTAGKLISEITIDGTVKHLTWSPDNNKVAFDIFINSFDKLKAYSSISVWDINTSTNTIIVDGRSGISAIYPEWSPDGKQIAYAAWDRYPDSSAQIYLINIDGTHPTKITSSDGLNKYSYSNPIWSPDSKQIVFVAQQINGRLDEKDCSAVAVSIFYTCHIDLYVINRDGSNLTQLTSKGVNRLPKWSNDGQTIIFLSLREKEFDAHIYVVDKDGENDRLLSSDSIAPAIDYGPLWK